MKRFLLFLCLIVVFPDVLWSQQSQFGNDFVLAGATCPPVNPPAHTGTLYTCTGTGALYTWTGSAWVAAGGGGGGTIGGTIASTQIAVGSGADTIGGSANLISNGTTITSGQESTLPAAIQNYWADGVISVFNNNNLLPATTILSTANDSNSVFADALNVMSYADGANELGGAIWAVSWKASALAYTDVFGMFMNTVTGVNANAMYGFESSIDWGTFASPTAVVTKSYNFKTSNVLYGAITSVYGFLDGTPDQLSPALGGAGGAETVSVWYSFYAAELNPAKITNGYYFWANSDGVYRIREDATFNSVGQAIPTLYNPQFAKYTAGATNFERCIPGCQWESNVAVMTTEAGGTGTLRALNLGDAGVQVQINAKNITLSGNLTTTGAFNPTFAIPSSSTWTFPSGGGTLLTNTGTSMTGPVTITEAVGSSALTLTGATQVTSFPVLNATQTWNASGTTFTAVKVNVTSTASAAASLLMDLQVGNSSQATISKGGNILGAVQTGGSGTNVAVGIAAGRGMWTGGGSQLDFAAGSNTLLTITQTASTLLVPSDGAIGFGPNTTTASSVGGTISVAFARDAANAMALRNGANAQTFNTYSTYTSATNNEYFNVLWSSSVLHLGTNKGSGGGTARVMQLDYGGTTTSAISIPITSGTVTFGGSTTANYYIGNGSGLTVANVGANSCGTTAATVAGGASSFEVTVGATSGTQCRVTLPTAAPNRWNCAPSNTSTAALVRAANVDTTNVDLLGVFTAGDVISVVCVPR